MGQRRIGRSKTLGLAIAVGLTACARLGAPDTDAERTGPPAPDYLPEPPKLAGPRLGLTALPAEAPFIGEAGNDAVDYPLRHPDQVALINLLRIKRFDLLERFMLFYQEQFEADFHKERWPADAANAFHSTEPAFGPLLDEWVKNSPNAYSAWLARGVYIHAVGWHMRGTKYAKDTSDAQMGALKTLLGNADSDLNRALELRPKSQVARQYLILSAMAAGGKLATLRQTLDKGIAECRLCYDIRASYVHTLEPRWGGSLVAMDRFASESAALLSENPKLGWLKGASAADRCRTLRAEKKVPEGHAACAESLRHGDLAETLVDKAYLFVQEERHAEALALVDRALRVDPQSSDALRLRQDLRTHGADYLGAARDLVLLRHLEPTDASVASEVSWLVKKLTFEGSQLFKANKPSEAAPYFQLGLELDPDNLDLMHRQGFAARDQVDTLLVEAQSKPDDFELRLRIDHAFASKGQFADVVKMWDTYIAAHPQDPRAYFERGGAKWYLRQQAESIADTQKACDLGNAKACAELPRLKVTPR